MGLKFSWVLKHLTSELIKHTLTLDLLMPHYLLTAKPINAKHFNAQVCGDSCSCISKYDSKAQYAFLSV